ncbi:MAG: response regulator [Leptospiraceae bacterium]|nr:response regulator [Leptospiraceae bacterium]
MISQLESIFNSIADSKGEDVSNKKPLLIIDDNQDVIDALTVILKREYELLVFKSYEETIEKKFSNINVALLDIKIAYQDGIEIFSLLKTKYPQMKIIFHSAYPGNNENAKRAESLPHDGYLTKGNYGIMELLDTIRKTFLKTTE